jgi:L-threonylcarbamoyladenylate synthase
VNFPIQPDGDEARARAAQIVRRGGLIAFRTDTFYGLGVDPFNEGALKALKVLKGREDAKPILVVIGDTKGADNLVADSSSLFKSVGENHWPGALTIVTRARRELPRDLTAGTETIGVRLPDDDEVRALVRACGGALTATSANPAGHAPARTALEVARYFPAGLDLIIDGGATRATQASTVLDISVLPARLIREGVVTRRELELTLQRIGARLARSSEDA